VGSGGLWASHESRTRLSEPHLLAGKLEIEDCTAINQPRMGKIIMWLSMKTAGVHSSSGREKKSFPKKKKKGKSCKSLSASSRY
jgi:hypothetical protein